MIHSLSPQEAEPLIAGGNLDVVDVRDARDWSEGHIPHARLVPLDDIKASPRDVLPKDGVIFVCARGVRSLTAAKVAESIGFTDLYNVAGGTDGWVNAGLPVERG